MPNNPGREGGRQVSEGLDFADRAGRAVIMTGIPYAMKVEPKVRLKREYMDELARPRPGGGGGQGSLSGDQWYVQTAMRAVNQAVGRVIRHKQDYGAVILADDRFASKNIVGQLSLWLRPYVRGSENFGKTQKALSDFFKAKADQGLLTDAAPIQIGGHSSNRRAVTISSEDVPLISGHHVPELNVANLNCTSLLSGSAAAGAPPRSASSGQRDTVREGPRSLQQGLSAPTSRQGSAAAAGSRAGGSTLAAMLSATRGALIPPAHPLPSAGPSRARSSAPGQREGSGLDETRRPGNGTVDRRHMAIEYDDQPPSHGLGGTRESVHGAGAELRSLQAGGRSRSLEARGGRVNLSEASSSHGQAGPEGCPDGAAPASEAEAAQKQRATKEFLARTRKEIGKENFERWLELLRQYKGHTIDIASLLEGVAALLQGPRQVELFQQFGAFIHDRHQKHFQHRLSAMQGHKQARLPPDDHSNVLGKRAHREVETSLMPAGTSSSRDLQEQDRRPSQQQDHPAGCNVASTSNGADPVMQGSLSLSKEHGAAAMRGMCGFCSGKWDAPHMSPCGHTCCWRCWLEVFRTVKPPACPTCSTLVRKGQLQKAFFA
ncbi:Regulator of telomere elongation helicase 1 [Cymbomonas tetramitiformis]|uniref:Regulator of telomere elongation helicase 1 n=1 Tax=Cymbomonas tetramitiformis TaxID=36881 RepID=A0AAE0GAN9_9CHLO|nr:Regulator of telomere elongation helicase 1 [Cymbomonas tetramitiformis]